MDTSSRADEMLSCYGKELHLTTNRVVRVGLTETLHSSETYSSLGHSECSSRGSSQCKGPEAEACLDL